MKKIVVIMFLMSFHNIFTMHNKKHAEYDKKRKSIPELISNEKLCRNKLVTDEKAARNKSYIKAHDELGERIQRQQLIDIKKLYRNELYKLMERELLTIDEEIARHKLCLESNKSLKISIFKYKSIELFQETDKFIQDIEQKTIKYEYIETNQEMYKNFQDIRKKLYNEN